MALEKGCTYYFEEVDPVTRTVLETINAENLGSFSEEQKRFWLTMTVERSIDE